MRRKDNSPVPVNVTTVRDLVTNVTALARHLGITPNGVYRWIKNNRIPGGKMIAVAQYYDIEIPMHLAQSDKTNSSRKINYKPRDTLPTCLQVQAGNLTVEQAANHLNLHPRAVQLILSNWGEQLSDLYSVLVQLEAKEISLDEAAKRLRVSKFNIHALRQKYGFRPEPRKKPEPRPIVARRQVAKDTALACIAGRMNLEEAEKESKLSWRTIHRAIAKYSPEFSLIDLTHWPKTFREAYSREIEENKAQLSVKLWKYAQTCGIPLKKWPKYPKNPDDWRAANVRKMMVHILLGDESVESIAEKRGADPKVLESLFTSDLRPLNLTWPEVIDAPIYSQITLAELLLALDDSSKTPRLRMIERLEEEKHGT